MSGEKHPGSIDEHPDLLTSSRKRSACRSGNRCSVSRHLRSPEARRAGPSLAASGETMIALRRTYWRRPALQLRRAALVALGCRVGEGAARETHAWHLRIENGGRPDEARRRPPSPGGRLVTGKRWHNVRA